jgi:hypothetical protein
MNIPDELYGEISKYLFVQDMLKLQMVNKHLSELEFINKTLYERVEKTQKYYQILDYMKVILMVKNYIILMIYMMTM